MLVFVVRFPEKYRPRKIAYKTYSQAVMICGNFNLSRACIDMLYVEEDETTTSFGDD